MYINTLKSPKYIQKYLFIPEWRRDPVSEKVYLRF